MDITRETVGTATALSFKQEESSSVKQNYTPAYNLGNQTVIMNRIQAQNMLTAVHQQFHQNQGKYIDLLSKLVEYQSVVLGKSENNSVYPKAMQNLEQILQILQNNQLNYNANHENYLQSQLTLIRGEDFTPNTTSTLDDSSALRVPNYPISETETVLPSTKTEEQQTVKTEITVAHPPTEQLPEVTPSYNGVNGDSPRQMLNYPISKTETVLPSTKTEEQQTVKAEITVAHPLTEQLPKVTPSYNGMNGDSPRQMLNYPISKTETVLPSKKEEEKKTVNPSASSQPTSVTVPSKATLRQIVITSESINDLVETKRVEDQKTVNPSASSQPTSAIVLPQVTPTSEPLTTIEKNITHSVESTSSVNGSSSPANSISVSKLLLEVVSDKTGYPIDMLDLSMDLQADLGIDSIKQVQILTSMQNEFPNMELDTDMLAELRTLAQVTDYMEDYLSSNQKTPLPNDLDQDQAIARQLVKKN